MRRKLSLFVAVAFAIIMVIAPASPLVPVAMAQTGEDAVTAPSWLEPRGLSVVELVGLVPDQYLQGTILSYDTGEGIVVYDSGSRTGSTVVINTTIYPRFSTPSWAPNQKLTTFGCLGQEPHYDHMGSVVPASMLRVYTTGGGEVTSGIYFMQISRVDKLQPSANSSSFFRYPTDQYGPPLPPLPPQGRSIPANSGCRLYIGGADYPVLKGVFTLQVEPSVQATVLGTQQETFNSYIGPGSIGIFGPLMQQLLATYGSRAPSVHLNIPDGANFFLLRFPPMPGDPYTDSGTNPPYLNAARQSAGTYRLRQPAHALSADLTFSAAFPVRRAWQDADQASGSYYLPVITSPSELETPEYILPAGIPYNNCFTQGNCSGTVLDQIYRQQMTLQVTYLSITRPAIGGEWIPLKMAGPGWSASAAGTDPAASDPALQMASPEAPLPRTLSGPLDHYVFLPLVSSAIPEETPPPGCPCGWFDSGGRMLGFSP
jgi:hypothetical protein